MKKIFLYLFAGLGMMSAQAQTYTDITPDKFKFNNYPVGSFNEIEVGATGSFWDTNQYIADKTHTVAGTASDSQSFISLASNANFGDNGYAYFYYNQSKSLNQFTSIVNVDGVGNVLEFGAFGGGFGGFYFVPFCEQKDYTIRTTIIFRGVSGSNNAKDDVGISIGNRSNSANGTDSFSEKNINPTTNGEKWHKAVIVSGSTYGLRFNFGQFLWHNKIQIAQVKFEIVPSTVSDDYNTCEASEFGLYLREHTANEDKNFNYSTICLPNASYIDGAELYQVTGKNKAENPTALYIDPVEGNLMQAGVAYLYMPTFTTGQVKFTALDTNNSVTSPEQSGALIGSFEEDKKVPEGKHYLKSNTWYKTMGNTKIRQYGAYLDLEKADVGSATPLSKIARISEDTTGIEGIGADSEENSEMFDLLGRPVDPQTHKGFAIVGGKKVFVK